MSGTNIGPWKRMMHWTAAETPSIMNGHQTHFPVGGSGRAMSRKGVAKGVPGSDRDGIKRKVRGSSIEAFKAQERARKAAYRNSKKK